MPSFETDVVRITTAATPTTLKTGGADGHQLVSIGVVGVGAVNPARITFYYNDGVNRRVIHSMSVPDNTTLGATDAYWSGFYQSPYRFIQSGDSIEAEVSTADDFDFIIGTKNLT